jgi:ubiquinone/menaquinone biosynthesis C-methylase UbiE
LIRIPERLLFGGGRLWACRRAAGDVLEVAIGTGRNLGAYPPEVQLTGIDLSAQMVALARERARVLGVAIDLHVGDAQDLPFDSARFDTVVCTLGLCSIPDDRRAVTEMHRVLRPGGRLVLLEHVRSPVRAVRIVQELMEPLFLRLAHDHLLREPLTAVELAGFRVDALELSKLGLVERLAATRPARLESSTGEV